MALSDYSKTAWANGTSPAINATNLAKIETAIDNITDDLIVNSEITETQSTSQILSLSACDVTSKLKGELRGVTTINLLDNNVAGCEATTGWTTARGTLTTDSSNELEGTNCLKFTRDATSTNGYTYFNISSLIDTNKYYLISAYLKNGNLSGLGINLRLTIQSVKAIESEYVTSSTYKRVAVIAQPSDFVGLTGLLIQPYFFGANTEYGYVDAIMLQEITATEYALGATALLNKYQYHRGLASSNPIMTQSVGKNLFDKNTAKLGERINESTGANTTSSASFRSEFIKVKKSSNYTVSSAVGTSKRYAFYDLNKTYISGASSASLTATFTAPANAEYIKISNELTGINSFQLEEGSTATTYEPYKETKAFITPTLASVSTIYDTYNLNSGLHTQNISEGVAISSGTAVNTTNYPLAEATSTFLIHLDAGGFETGVVGTDSASGDGTLYYKLATPLQTQYPSNIMNAYKDGTVYTIPAIQETAYYDSGITVNASYPIANLMKVYKVNTTTNTQTPISLSACTVASGGASFTISGASDGELYGYEYEYNFLSTIPTLSYSYANNTITSQKGTHELLSEVQKKLDYIKTNIIVPKNFKTLTTFNIANTTAQVDVDIPTGATEIEIVYKNIKTNTSPSYMTIQFNGDTGNNYFWDIEYGSGETSGKGVSSIRVGWDTTAASYVGMGKINIFKYSGQYTFVRFQGLRYYSVTPSSSVSLIGGGTYNSTDTLTSITFVPDSGTFYSGDITIRYKED